MVTDVNEPMLWREHIWRRVERDNHSTPVTTYKQGQPRHHTSGDNLPLCLGHGQ